MRHVGNPLGVPRRTNVPTPHNAFVKKRMRETRRDTHERTAESTFASLFVFENAKAAKNLEVLAWKVEIKSTLHYAYQLTVVDV